MLEKTSLFNIDEIEDTLIKKTLEDVYVALEEKGYNPVNQLVGYLTSGDPGYISSYKDARNKISKYDRSKILITILKEYLFK
ncbi:MAG: IreB family regulatory phosphoprotein [Bacilli bacterium]|nr:IreB family regulatory phosphoprotein [Bacilli bacterium]MDD4795377.1 IreB family regulatory phosphoprotein [Bacilli bacterium]